jgi:chromosome segregation ATPase
MPYLLDDLVINRVDLVDEGANSAAFIELYKRKERDEPMDYKEVIAKMNPEQGKLVQAELDRLAGEVTKAQEDLGAVTTERDEAQKKLDEASANLETANGDLAAAKSELDALKEEQKLNDEAAKKAAFDEEETMKAMPKEARELFTKMKAQKDAAEEELRKSKEAEKHAEAVSKAAALKALPVEQEKLVELVKGASPAVLELLSTVATAMEETALGEVGKNKAGTGNASTSNEAWAQIEAKAAEVAKKDNISKAKAISKVVDENPDLYKQYLQGGAN